MIGKVRSFILIAIVALVSMPSAASPFFGTNESGASARAVTVCLPILLLNGQQVGVVCCAWVDGDTACAVGTF